ncbi:transposase [Paenibacillus pinihumi]|uniref:transposase n=1 Tax=Paenibacillus pinihumi TaxID=669462 RepID=UPI0003FB6AFA|nr:transposase [Paenibacillus pinihumi]
MERKSVIHENATIYHYQLVKKIQVMNESVISYGIIVSGLGIFQIMMYGYIGLLLWLVSALAIYLLHWVIIKLTMLRVDEPEDRRWGWRYKSPWIGYLPIAMVEHQLFRRLHRHLLWIGLCAVALIYPWMNESVMISLLSWHLWALAPRLLILNKLRRSKKDGLILLEDTSFSFYHR